jgi:hypothetical protein
MRQTDEKLINANKIPLNLWNTWLNGCIKSISGKPDP